MSDATTAYQETADFAARDAHENHFSVRRAVWSIEGYSGDVLYIDNNPYADDPERRTSELQVLRDWLAVRGYDVLAEGAYPKAGEQAGYTVALLIRIDSAAADDMSRAMGAVLSGQLVAAIGRP